MLAGCDLLLLWFLHVGVYRGGNNAQSTILSRNICVKKKKKVACSASDTKPQCRYIFVNVSTFSSELGALMLGVSSELQASEVAPPTEQETICILRTSTGEAKRTRRADKMDPLAKKKRKKRARCSEGRGGGARSDRSQGVEKQETWALTLSGKVSPSCTDI